mmetsp:Transcript_8303/g.51735  ORF Transcript_8303/g.51735 Transcript_8303/m.51735 type:complete len:99 (+) Transcript_8303:1468-1764(+)
MVGLLQLQPEADALGQAHLGAGGKQMVYSCRAVLPSSPPEIHHFQDGIERSARPGGWSSHCLPPRGASPLATAQRDGVPNDPDMTVIDNKFVNNFLIL